ncbi:fatty acid synthase-like [Sitophilus oryzae]|uniref:Fatty acid synthase-like n=1 Tax=Sitophilus oryzae TaxID=7048 RepID=A0A6J2YJ43_SITOR|nr:fatty acid synthase-like [Sitophilus oryzae]
MHGTGTLIGDRVECQTVVDCFLQNRNKPLLVGSVKSNMGHAEVSAGLCSISKVLIAMETGMIPANIYCDNLDNTLPGLNNGGLKVVTEHLPLDSNIVALNNYGYGGANGHVVLRSNSKSRAKHSQLNHRLVHVSGRTEEAVNYYLEEIEKNQNDHDFLALIDAIHRTNVDGHLYRGYSVLGTNPLKEIQKYDTKKRPIWFIYSGMGSQWSGMGKDLMKLDVFRKTFKKCADALKPYNVDLEKVILSDDPTVLDDIVNCFSSIAAVSIALTDVLKSFGIEADFFAGHSLGETGCAYYNGGITAEQATLIGFARGYTTLQAKCKQNGQMAAVGLGKDECLSLLPEGVYIACVNGFKNVTVSGEKTKVKEFVEDLTNHGIFARLVPTANYAFHSKYVSEAVPILKDFVDKLIPNPKPRSPKWISSSWDEDDSENPLSKLNSGDYHAHNYGNTVFFDQVLKQIPKDAILIEVSPHALLTPILRRELGSDITYLSLANRNSQDNVQHLLSNIGQLFINGGQPDLRQFYNEVSFPVGRGTANIGSLIKWDHRDKWLVPLFDPLGKYGKQVIVNSELDTYKSWIGHNIDGRILVPAVGYLMLVWSVMAEIKATHIEKLPIVFESVKFLRATVLPTDKDITFIVNIMRKSGYFEIFESGSICCTGTVQTPQNISKYLSDEDEEPPIENTDLVLEKDDIYKSFYLRRYLYSGNFQGIERTDLDGNFAELSWNQDFTSFLDTLIQLPLVSNYNTALLLPTRLQSLSIDPVKFLSNLTEINKRISAYYLKNTNTIKCPGVEIVNIEISVAPSRDYAQSDAILQNQVFVPYGPNSNITSFSTALSIALQIIFENCKGMNLVAKKFLTEEKEFLEKALKEILEKEPCITVDFVGSSQNCDFVITDIVDFEENSLIENGFVLFVGSDKHTIHSNYKIIYSTTTCDSQDVYLYRYLSPPSSQVLITINNEDFTWIEEVQNALNNEIEAVYLVNNDHGFSGVMGLVRCINLEPIKKTIVKCIFIEDDNIKDVLLSNPYFVKQLRKNLVFNVLKNGVWGGYRYLPFQKLENKKVSNAYNAPLVVRDLSTLAWIEQPAEYDVPWKGSETVYVFYSALNFKDVMVSTGKLISTSANAKYFNTTGIEYSGTTKDGKRVMGLSIKTIALQTVTDPLFTWNVPDHWSLEQAATVPSVYATCYYALFERGRLDEGESILIHAGAGGVGIAAITLALSMNCEVYTTVGSEEKRKFLLELFPRLNPENIGHSRNDSFEKMIMKRTNGRGVDIVLNSLSGNLYQASIRCVAQGGRFLEIGKVDLWSGTPISSSLFAKNTTFHGVHLDALFLENSKVKERVSKGLREGLLKGNVRPLPREIFTDDKIEEAFRLMLSGEHKGKILIKIRDENKETIRSPEKFITASPRLYFSSDSTYILVGGLGGFGLELTQFLIDRGAKKIILNSRRSTTTGYQSYCLRRWSFNKELVIKISKDDTSTLDGAEALVKYAKSFGTVKGIFNMALVLDDALFRNQTADKYKNVFKPKLYSGSNMDIVTRKLCKDLDYFVVFSTMTSGKGNPGQSNYGMSNSALERLCEKRKEDNLHALAIQYGPVADVGFVFEAMKTKPVEMHHLVPQNIYSCLNALESFMLQSCIIVSTYCVAEKNKTSCTIKKSLVDTVAHIIGIKNMDAFDKNQQLPQLGMDSLMAAEIKQVMYRTFNIDMEAEQLKDLTFTKLQELSQSCSIDNPNSCTNGFKSTEVKLKIAKESVIPIINDPSYTTKIFLFHPLEGHIKALIPLAEELKANVYGLQSLDDRDSEDMEVLTTKFVEEIRRIQPEGPYILCGYSFGGILGFDVGVQLEKQGERVRMFLIDGTPFLMKIMLNFILDKSSNVKQVSKAKIFRHFIPNIEERDDELTTIFDSSMSHQEKIEQIRNNILSKYGHDRETALYINGLFRRVLAGYYYETSNMFKGDVTLFRSTSESTPYFSNDYDLQQVCKQSIDLKPLKGNHREILFGDNLSYIANDINSYLSRSR